LESFNLLEDRVGVAESTCFQSGTSFSLQGRYLR
jgi:hypothetical protein